MAAVRFCFVFMVTFSLKLIIKLLLTLELLELLYRIITNLPLASSSFRGM